MSGQSRALEGIDVLDLGHIYNGPFCSLVLGYLGADVVKIEPPHGEYLRSRTPPGVEPLEIIMMNSSKDGITLDLKDERGKELFLELVAEADIVVENFGVDTMDRLGLGYETLSGVNPELVYAHGTGYGEEGPYTNYPAMDLTIQAMGGVMASTGFTDNPPVASGAAVGDFMGGITLAAGVLAALYQREITGEGQHVEVGMLDAVYPTVTSPIVAHYRDDDVPPRTGNRHSSLARCPYNVYETADGYVAIFCLSQKHWYGLLDIMDRSDLRGDERYEENVDRVERMDEVDEMIEAWTVERERDAIVDQLLEADIPCGPVRDIEEVIHCPHLEARDMVREIDHPNFGRVRVPGLPIRLSDSQPPEIRPSPSKGRDNRDVYAERLGLTDEEIDELERTDVI